MTTLWAPNSGSVYAANSVIPLSASGKLTWLFLISDVNKAASCNITFGEISPSVLMTLRSASGRQSPTVGPIATTSGCLVIADLDSGDVIALIRT